MTHRPKLFPCCASRSLVPGSQYPVSSASGMSVIPPQPLVSPESSFGSSPALLRGVTAISSGDRLSYSQGYSGHQLPMGTQVTAWSIPPHSAGACPLPAQQATFGTMTCLSSILACSLHLEKAVSQDKVLSLESQKMRSILMRSVGRSGQYPPSGTVGVWKRWRS